MNPIYKLVELTPEEICRRIPESKFCARWIIVALAVIQGMSLNKAGRLIEESKYRAEAIFFRFSCTALKNELEPGEKNLEVWYGTLREKRKHKEFWLDRVIKVAEHWGVLKFLEEISMTEFVDSTSDQRTVNNVMRHAYRVLTDEEKALMQALKDKGLELHDLIDSIGNSRELALAKTKTEEAVMWAVKHLTR